MFYLLINIRIAQMPEWFKGVDLRSIIVRCVGSNPTLCKFLIYLLISLIKKIIYF